LSTYGFSFRAGLSASLPSLFATTRPTDTFFRDTVVCISPRRLAGLARSEVRRDGDKWIADAPFGKVRVRFVPRNSFGVTEVNIVQEGIPEAIPPEACYLGWQESLTLLAQLIEAEIPG
jgi:Activator of Hsp90 ATPase homolog 1-like protein